jgi:MoaA/NifB/PqqE/SkfB family radical SAM enzyme
VHIEPELRRLPLVTLYLTERCNSRCVTCDYWRHGRTDMDAARVLELLPGLIELGTRVALISGGEPLLNPQWAEIAQLLRAHGVRLWLLTSGLSLAKHAARVAQLFDAVTVSLDGTDADTYAAIRGLNAFERVCAGIRASVAAGSELGIRVTVQRANFRQLPRFVMLARALGVRQLSFVAVDVANAHAFSRQDGITPQLALNEADLPVLGEVLEELERVHAADFRSGLIAESPRKLRRMQQYFAAVCGRAPYPAVRCNVFEYSAVIDAAGRTHPCFFIPGPVPGPERRAPALNSPAMRTLRAAIRSGARLECARCVCSLWREPEERELADFLIRRYVHA